MVAVLALASTFVWANGSQEGTGTSASGEQMLKLGSDGMPVYDGPPVTLEFWNWAPGTDITVSAFEAAYPNIKIEWNNVGTSTTEYNKLTTALQAGSGAPDVVQISFEALPTFMDSGGLVDLAQYGAAQVADQFVPFTWGQVSQGSKVYAIPQGTGPMVLAYNKAIFDEYGLTVPKTWDEFATAGKKLYDATNGEVKIGNFDVAGSRGGLMFPPLLRGAGGHFWEQRGDTWVQTIDNPKMLNILKYWDDLVKKGYATNYFPYTTDYFNGISTGHVATVLAAAWSPKLIALNAGDEYAGDWRIAPLPQWPDVSTFTGSNWGGGANAVTVQSENPLAALIFDIWLSASTTATDLSWLNGGLFPASVAGLKTPTIHDTSTDTNQYFGGQDLAAEFENAAKSVDVNFTWAPWYNYTESTLSTAANAAVNGKMSWEQALSGAQKDIADFARGQGYTVKTQ